MEDSPAKKLRFEPLDKENAQLDIPVLDDFDLKKSQLDLVKPKEKPVVAPTMKELEAEEPLLKENPHRFVMFPIKYHEVGFPDASRVKCFRVAKSSQPFYP